MSLAIILNIVTLVVMALIGVIFASVRRDSRDNKTAIDKLNDKLEKVDRSIVGVKLELGGLNGKYKEWTRKLVKKSVQEQVEACRDREDELSGVHSMPPSLRRV